MTQLIVDARNLVKKYGDFTAVNDVSFTIEEGQVFGLLGPNGAGKSTTISMLTCLFPPSNGSARVGGHDVVQDADQVKQRSARAKAHPATPHLSPTRRRARRRLHLRHQGALCRGRDV